MSSATLRLLLPIFTYLGILTLKYDRIKNKFVLSKLFPLLNALVMPTVFFFTMILITKPFIQEIYASYFLGRFSLFSFLNLVRSQVMQITCLFISFHQILKRREILQFMNEVNQIVLHEKFSKKLKAMSIKVFAFMSFLFLLVAIIELFTDKITFKYLILLYPYLFTTAFLTFIKIFEFVFTVLIANFRHDLKFTIQKVFINEIDHKTLAKNLQRIFELSEKFNQIFGFQLTIMTSCTTILTTFEVPDIFFKVL